MRYAETPWFSIRITVGALAGLLWLASAQAIEPSCTAPGFDSGVAAGQASYAGRVLFIKGGANAQLPGAGVRALAKDSPVCQGDTLVSGDGALVQLQMADGGKLVLREKTRMNIDTFANPSAKDGSERFAVTLIVGGLRAITGLIGRIHKDNYSIQTSTAVIGIRGTDHEVFFVPTAALPPERAAEAGTYNRVFSGATFLRTVQGQVVLGPRQVGFAPLTGASPFLLKALPNFLGALPTEIHGALRLQKEMQAAAEAAPKGSPDDATANGTASAVAQADVTAPAAGDSSDPGQPPAATTPDALQAVSEPPSDGTGTADDITTPVDVMIGNLKVDLTASSDQTMPAPAGSAYVGAHAANANGGNAVGSAISDDQNLTIHLESSTGLPVVVVNGPGGFNYQARRANIVDFGLATVDGAAAMWGLYDGGVVVDPASSAEQPLGFHHFAFAPGGATSPQVIASLSGNARFNNIVGYTQPTNESGLAGGKLLSCDVSVDLGAKPGVTGYAVNLVDALMREWEGGFTGFLSLNEFQGGKLPLTVRCGGTGCGSGSGNGSAAGVLIGDNAKGLITAYSLGTTTGQASTGTAVLSHESAIVTLPEPANSAYVGAHVDSGAAGITVTTGGLVTNYQNAGVQSDARTGLPVAVFDGQSGFNYQARQAKMLDFGSATVDGASVKWGLYDGGVSVELSTGIEKILDFHQFVLAPNGATSPDVIATLAGSASFGNIVGSTPPTGEGGLVGGKLQSLSINVDLGAKPGVTGYSVGVQDAKMRNWAGSFTGFSPLANFAAGKLPLTAQCSGAGCGSGSGSGSAAGILIGNNAMGLMTTYSLGTTTGQGVAGAAVLTRR